MTPQGPDALPSTARCAPWPAISGDCKPAGYKWCDSDEIDHTALMGRVRHRIGDKRVVGWVKAFLRAGVLSDDGLNRDTITHTRVCTA